MPGSNGPDTLPEKSQFTPFFTASKALNCKHPCHLQVYLNVGRHVFSPLTSRASVRGPAHPSHDPPAPAPRFHKPKIPNEPIVRPQPICISALQRIHEPIRTPQTGPIFSPARRPQPAW